MKYSVFRINKRKDVYDFFFFKIEQIHGKQIIQG